MVSALQQQFLGAPEVVLVSKDINMRIKARALGLPAEDYFNDQVLEDKDLLYAGAMQLPNDFWAKHGKGVESWQDPKSGAMFYRLTGPLVPSFLVNQFVYLEPMDGSLPLYAQVKEINGKTALLQTLKDYTHNKNNVWSVVARNREQNFALNLLMSPDIDFVTLLGQAGTGKTLLALASGLEQVLDQKLYNEIIVTRATVPVGEDIGFLPGTEEEKMQPWMGAFDDNLEVLQKSDDSAGDWGRAATQELIRSRIKVKSMNFMRGRTFVNKFVIIDEAQNLTPKQMKTLVTRAGPGTKIVCLGNIAQIDTPYLTEGLVGPDLRGGPLQGLEPQRPRHAGARRTPRAWPTTRRTCSEAAAARAGPALAAGAPPVPPRRTPLWPRRRAPPWVALRYGACLSAIPAWRRRAFGRQPKRGPCSAMMPALRLICCMSAKSGRRRWTSQQPFNSILMPGSPRTAFPARSRAARRRRMAGGRA